MRNLNDALHQQRGPTSSRTPLDWRRRAPRRHWLLLASIKGAVFPGLDCKKQRTVRINHRCPKEPPARATPPQPGTTIPVSVEMRRGGGFRMRWYRSGRDGLATHFYYRQLSKHLIRLPVLASTFPARDSQDSARGSDVLIHSRMSHTRHTLVERKSKHPWVGRS